MEIKEIENKDVWEKFLRECEEKTFLQSFNWGEFQKMMGNKIWRLGIYEISNLIGVALVIKVEAKRGTFLFVPHGPNLRNSKSETLNPKQILNSKFKILNTLLEKLKEIAKEEKCDFIRIAPILERNEENEKIFKDLGFRQAPIHIHPELTWELDLSPSENELLMAMRKTTRYLIRQAQKNKEIEIEEENNLEGIEKFNQIYQLTKERHSFVPFSLEYLKNEFLAFSKENQVSVFLGKYKGEIVSGGIFIIWQKIGFYHHGASSQKYPKIPVSYLLLWEAIKKAKNLGCQKFNFWGIAPITSDLKIQNLNHPWAGLTLFKIGFGGYKKEYVKTQDLIISKKYWLNFIVEKLRKVKRGL
jgi:lipid II:glycine glycyltransferase (peptidoglycan interpeptide bridge formation enzyme)